MSGISAMLPKDEFPIFSAFQAEQNRPLVYLDSAATSQKPRSVLDAMTTYYSTENANVHRGIHTLGDASTKRLTVSRERIARFFSTKPNQLIFTRNTTESLNGVAYGIEHLLDSTSEIVVTEVEHHSNIVPWQQLAQRTGARLNTVSVDETGLISADAIEKQLSKNTAVVAITHVSNALGTIQPLDALVERIRKIAKSAWIVLDGAQSAPHIPVEFENLGVDAFAFSGHKMLGPMGVGGLILSSRLLIALNPWFYGGGMIDEVEMQSSTFADLPDRFMPGTPDVASIAGLAEAVEVLSKLKMTKVREHDHALTTYALEKLQAVPFLELVGPKSADQRVGSVSFLISGVHAHDVAQVLDSQGVAVRSGHHCTMPLHKKMGWPATTRASFSVYTSSEDIDALIDALDKVRSVFSLK